MSSQTALSMREFRSIRSTVIQAEDFTNFTDTTGITGFMRDEVQQLAG